MQNTEKRRTTRYRRNRILCGIVCVVISFIVMAAAVAVTIGLAVLGTGYSIAAATVLICLEVLFLVVPIIGCGVFCCRRGRWEADIFFAAVVCSLTVVFVLAPFFYVIAAVLCIAELTMGKGDDDMGILGLAVLAAVLNILAAVASIFLCVISCLYLCRRRPAEKEGEREKETLVMKKKEIKLSQIEEREEEKTTPFS